MTFGILSDKVILYGLDTWEVLIGIGLIFKIFLRETLLLLYLQMPGTLMQMPGTLMQMPGTFMQMLGTFMPIFLFPGEVFHLFRISFTLEGQYIVKNIVLLSTGIVFEATVRGGMLVTEVREADKL
jgi:hypothetical protein